MSQASRRSALRPWREREKVAKELARAGCLVCFGGRAGEVRGDDIAAALLLPSLRSTGAVCVDVHAAREHARRLLGETGRGRAKLGQAIIDALDGQPSECQACDGWGFEQEVKWPKVYDMPPGMSEYSIAWNREWWDTVDVFEKRDAHGALIRQALFCERRCPDCGGTGHNLRGYLPEVEVSPQLRRRIREIAEAAYARNGGPQGEAHRAFAAQREALARWGVPNPAHECVELEMQRDTRTRVTPRGEHRFKLIYPGPSGVLLRDQKRGHALRSRVGYGPGREGLYGVQHDAHVYAWKLRRLPSRERGELRHAQQRRERGRK